MSYRKSLYEHYVSRHTSLIYDISIKTLERQRRAYRRYFSRFLPKDKSIKILDIGSGYGGFLYFLEKEGYKNIFGVDCSQEQVDMSQKLGIKNVVCADIIDTLKKYSEELDMIIALDVVEHFQKDELFLLFESIICALKPGGIFIMQSPNADGIFSGRYRYWDLSHEIAFTPTSIRQILLHVGFKEVRIYATIPVIHGIFSFLRYVLWQFIRYILILYLAVETGSFKGHILTQNLIAVGRR